MMRELHKVVKDFLDTEFARHTCNDELICDLIAEMHEITYELAKTEVNSG